MLKHCWFSSIRCASVQISDMSLGVNIIGGKVSVASINGAGWFWECSETLAGVLGGSAP